MKLIDPAVYHERFMLQALFHAWGRHLVGVTKDRVVRPFEWGLEWIPPNGHASGAAPDVVLRDWVSHVMADTDAFFTPAPTSDYSLDGGVLRFPSALVTPHESNNRVYCRFFPARDAGRPFQGRRFRPAVLVLPQWNA